MKAVPLLAHSSRHVEIAQLLNLDDFDGSTLAEVITDYFGDRGSSDEEGFPEDSNYNKQTTHLPAPCIRYSK